MKIRVCSVFIFIACVFISCAGRQASVLKTPGPGIIESLSEYEITTLLESATRLVKQNSLDIKKQYILDEARNIIVKADLSEFLGMPMEVIYNMKDFQAAPSGGFIVPFTVGFTGTDVNRQDDLFWIPGNDASGILLSFDDEHYESWKNHFDLLSQYNVWVTFFVMDFNIEFCLAAVEQGHEVGYHTINHLNLMKVSRSVFRRETVSQSALFRKAGIPLSAFAYPYGFYEPWMHRELLKNFRVLRGYGVTYNLYEPSQINNGFSSAKGLDNTLFKQDDEFETAVNIMLRTVKFIGGDRVLPLTTHEISDDAAWGIKPQRLEYLFQTAHDLGLTFYRYMDFE